MSSHPELSAHEYDDKYQSKPIWGIGRPQKAYVDLFTATPPQSPVLDIGCGSGDLAIFVAGLGCDVLGVDFAPAAIAQAAAKAHAAGSMASFKVYDLFSGPALDQSFKTVLDCCFFHTLADSSRVKYEQRLRNLLEPNGLVYMLCHADRVGKRARAVARQDIERVFAAGWTILRVEPSVMEVSFIPAGQGKPAIFACLKKSAA